MNLGFEKICLQPAIRGKIADLLDYPVAAARVVLSGSKLAEKMCTVTGSGGSFMFSRIPPGVYTLEVLYSGFSKLVQRGIAVQDHAITGLDLKMDFLEDSRTIKLQALSLEVIDDMPAAGDPEAPSSLDRQLHEVMASLFLDRALFNPPPVLKVGRRAVIEFGAYQNLREEIMRRLLERKISRFESSQLEVTLNAELQAAGCRVLPLSLPQVAITGARYVEWKWEIMPQISGQGLISLNLQTRVNFAEYGEHKKCLLVLDREVRIKNSYVVQWQRWMNDKSV
jgi:hypothetical protein